VRHVKGEATLADFQYTVDPVGNPTQAARSGLLSETQTYEYDAQDRLTEVCYQSSCPGGSDPFIRWTYDDVGNRLTEARPSGTVNYSYNAADQLTQAGSTSFDYDANGNEIEAGSTTYAYDLANRLLTVDDGSTTTGYAYDGDGNRLEADDGSSVVRYLWDQSFGLPQLALERTGGGSLIRRYLYGQGRISMTTGGNLFYYHTDMLGSVAHLTDSSGDSQWTYGYEPYGAVKTETQDDAGAPANPIRFTGELQDETGLTHLRARQYDSTTGRFLSLDPLAPRAASASVSSYAYVSNRPTAFVDPGGLTSVPIDAGTSRQLLVSSSAGPRAPRVSPDSPECIVGGRRLDCTEVAFIEATWDQRLVWLRGFDKTYNIGHWLDVFRGILKYFKGSSYLSDSVWAKKSDGYVLWAIQVGMARATGKKTGQSGWSQFFKALRRGRDETALKALWGQAEQQGVDFGVGLADLQGLRPGGETGELIDVFLYTGDKYRGAVYADRKLDVGPVLGWLGLRSTSGPADPRNDAAVVYHNARALERWYEWLG
jgi:RHS repeat-associated protein